MALDDFKKQTILYNEDGTPVALNSGVVTDSTLRVVLGSNVSLPSGTNNIGSVTIGNTVLQVSGTVIVSGRIAIADPLPVGNNNIGDVDVVSVSGTIDSGNSTTTPLGGGATFTGTAFDVTNYATVVVIAKSNQASATNGVKFQWSPDATNWDFEMTFDAPADTGRAGEVPHRARFFRVVYVNGASAQASFRLQTIHRPISAAINQRPLEAVIDADNFGQIVRAVLAAKNNSGNYINIDATNGGNLKVSVEEFNSSLPAGTNNIGDVDIASLPNEGQQTMANSISVAIASDQSVIQVSGTVSVSGIVFPDPISVDDNGDSLTVDNPTLSVVGGGVEAAALRVTIANDSTGVLSVDDNGGSLTIDAVTLPLPTGAATEVTLAGILTSVQIMDDWDETDRAKVNPIVGQAGVAAGAGTTDATTQRVTIATDDILSSGIGVLAQWDENDRCRVNIISGQVAITAGAGAVAANTPRVTLASDDPAVASLSVLDDWDETDRAKVNIIVGQAGITAGAGAVAANTPRVTHASDDPVTTSVQLIDDTVFTDDTSTHATGTTKGIGIMAAATPTDASVNANDIGMVAMTTDRKLHVSVQDAIPAGTNNIGDVDVLSVVPGTGATNLGKAEDGAHTTGDVGVMALGTANEANTVRCADNDYVPFATDTEGNARNVGNRDHDATDAGEPVKIGYKAIAHGSNPTAVGANDRTDAYANRHGVPWVIGGHPNIISSGINLTAAFTDQALITVATGNKIILTRLSVFADNGNSVDVAVTIGWGTSTIGNIVAKHPGIPPGSGFVEGTGAGILAIGTDDQDLRITNEVPTGGAIGVNFSYYTVES